MYVRKKAYYTTRRRARNKARLAGSNSLISPVRRTKTSRRTSRRDTPTHPPGGRPFSRLAARHRSKMRIRWTRSCTCGAARAATTSQSSWWQKSHRRVVATTTSVVGGWETSTTRSPPPPMTTTTSTTTTTRRVPPKSTSTEGGRMCGWRRGRGARRTRTTQRRPRRLVVGRRWRRVRRES